MFTFFIVTKFLKFNRFTSSTAKTSRPLVKDIVWNFTGQNLTPISGLHLRKNATDVNVDAAPKSSSSSSNATSCANCSPPNMVQHRFLSHMWYRWRGYPDFNPKNHLVARLYWKSCFKESRSNDAFRRRPLTSTETQLQQQKKIGRES